MPCDKKFQITQHLQTAAHRNAVNKKVSKIQTTLPAAFSASTSGNDCNDNFSKDICKALVSANIPLNKLNNVEFRTFLEKYTKRKVPDESTIRKNYVGKVYEEVSLNIYLMKLVCMSATPISSILSILNFIKTCQCLKFFKCINQNYIKIET